MRSLTSTANDNNDKRRQILATMFAAYGQAGDEKRLAAYAMALKGVPERLLLKACHKLMLENKFLPAVSEILQACRSLIGSVFDNKRERTWAEAWTEIMDQVRRCGTYEKPKWSTPEIAAAVKSYGYIDLCSLQQNELQTASAQCRRFYEDACRQKNETDINNFVLKKISGAEMIGLLPDQKIISIESRRKKA